jgi:hypothetical protein
MKKVFLFCLLFTSQLFAEDLKLGEASYGGTGCPAGSASVSLAPDQKSLSILFDSYVAESGYTTGRTVDRKSCNIVIPVKVPQGFSVSIFQVDYRGFNAVPANGASTRFNAEYFWAGIRGPKISRIFRGPLNDNFTVSDELLTTALVWAPCGKSVNLRVNTSMVAISNQNFDQTMGAVDSADVSGGIIYHLQFRRCH